MRVFALIIAVALSVGAGFLSLKWLDQQARHPHEGSIVVAATTLRFGTELGHENLREIDWPGSHMPEGAFAKISDLVKPGERRVALSAFAANEPILSSQITGPGQRPSLSLLIQPGMKAVAIRVNDVTGAGGFILPGDRVDVLLTRQNSEVAGAEQRGDYTNVLLQNVRVLAIDQIADEQSDKTIVAKTATIEVLPRDAQRLALASAIGSLSLVLRPPNAPLQLATEAVSTEDLIPGVKKSAPAVVVSAPVPAPAVPLPVVADPPKLVSHLVTVFVTRGVDRQPYDVVKARP